MTQDGKDYFKLLGSRVAQLRKDRGLTQVQLAKSLSVNIGALLSAESVKAQNKRGPAPKSQHRLERINALPRARQKFVLDVLENMLAQQAR